MKVGKDVYIIYPGCLNMFTVVMFTNEFHYFVLDIVPCVFSVQFMGVPNYFDLICIWQKVTKGHESWKTVYCIYPGCFKVCTIVTFTNELEYSLLDIVWINNVAIEYDPKAISKVIESLNNTKID